MKFYTGNFPYLSCTPYRIFKITEFQLTTQRYVGRQTVFYYFTRQLFTTVFTRKMHPPPSHTTKYQYQISLQKKKNCYNKFCMVEAQRNTKGIQVVLFLYILWQPGLLVSPVKDCKDYIHQHLKDKYGT